MLLILLLIQLEEGTLLFASVYIYMNFVHLYNLRFMVSIVGRHFNALLIPPLPSTPPKSNYG